MGSEAKIVELLTDTYGVEPERIYPDAKMADFGLDSITLAELVCDIEDALGIRIPMEEARFETFGEAVAVVDRLVGAKE